MSKLLFKVGDILRYKQDDGTREIVKGIRVDAMGKEWYLIDQIIPEFIENANYGDYGIQRHIQEQFMIIDADYMVKIQFQKDLEELLNEKT